MSEFKSFEKTVLDQLLIDQMQKDERKIAKELEGMIDNLAPLFADKDFYEKLYVWAITGAIASTNDYDLSLNIYSPEFLRQT